MTSTGTEGYTGACVSQEGQLSLVTTPEPQLNMYKYK